MTDSGQDGLRLFFKGAGQKLWETLETVRTHRVGQQSDVITSINNIGHYAGITQE